MRIKAGDLDACRVRIFLDGVEQKNCTEADDDEGYVIRYAIDENGRFKADARFDPILEKVEGDVLIQFDLPVGEA